MFWNFLSNIIQAGIVDFPKDVLAPAQSYMPKLAAELMGKEHAVLTCQASPDLKCRPSEKHSLVFCCFATGTSGIWDHLGSLPGREVTWAEALIHTAWASSCKSYPRPFQTVECQAVWEMSKANSSLQPKGPSRLFSSSVFFLTIVFTELISTIPFAQYPAMALAA